jgi:hypothetical protein
MLCKRGFAPYAKIDFAADSAATMRKSSGMRVEIAQILQQIVSLMTLFPRFKENLECCNSCFGKEATPNRDPLKISYLHVLLPELQRGEQKSLLR